MSWQIEKEISAMPGAPGMARSIASTELAPRLGPGASELSADVALVLSELVTNAISAGSTMIGIVIQLSGGRVRVEVTDDGIGWPGSRPASSTAIDGRGLIIVAALADRWGANSVPGGKAVWATFIVPTNARL